jgi:hypothetical protein
VSNGNKALPYSTCRGQGFGFRASGFGFRAHRTQESVAVLDVTELRQNSFFAPALPFAFAVGPEPLCHSAKAISDDDSLETQPLDPRPYIHPAPYTLHSTPYILHPEPTP